MPPDLSASTAEGGAAAPGPVRRFLKRNSAPLAALVIALAVLVPQLGSFGFWDPQETRIGDQAKGLVERSGPTPPGYVPPLPMQKAPPLLAGSVDSRPVLQPALIGWSFRLFGVRELAGRLPLLLASLLVLLCLYWVGAALLSRRAAALAVGVLATTPLFAFQARQLTSEAMLDLGVTAVFASAIRLCAALARKERRAAVLAGAVLALALPFSALAGGLFLGIAMPLAAVSMAAGFLVWRRPRLERGRRSLVLLVVGFGGIAVLVLAVAFGRLALLQTSFYSWLFGGTPMASRGNAASFEYFIKQVGFGFFPWCALLVPALGTALLPGGDLPVPPRRAEPDEPPPTARCSRDRSEEALDVATLARSGAAIWIVAAFVLGTVWASHCGDLLYPALPALALVTGDLLDQMLGGSGHLPAPRTLTALAGMAVLLTVGRDLLLYPQGLAFVQLTSPPTFPADLTPPMPPIFFGVGIACAALLALQLVPPLGRGPARLRRLTTWLGARTTSTWGFIGACVAFGLFVTQVLTPRLSAYFSQREVFEMYHACAAGSEPLAAFGESGSGARYYGGGLTVKPLGTTVALMDFLKRPDRVFAIVPASQLPQINETAHQAGAPLHVVLGRGRSLLLSNKLGGKCTQDQNEISQYLSPAPPHPQHPVSVSWEGKVQLLGWDGPDTVRNGTTFPFTMHFKVLSGLPPGYKIFMHFDEVSAPVRFQGDHEPCNGKLPLEFWTPGMYVTDPYQVEVGGAITGGVPPGDYTVYMGFWQGDNRLKVTEGKSDGSNRAILGTIHVK